MDGACTLDFGLYAEHRNQQRKQTLAGRPFQSCQWTARCQEPSFPPPSSVPSAGKKTESFASFCRSPLLGEWAHHHHYTPLQRRFASTRRSSSGGAEGRAAV